MSGINLTEVPSGTTAVKRDEDRACLGESRIGIRMRVSQIPFVSGNKKGSTFMWTLLDRQQDRILFGRRDWTRTSDPHHVKVVL